MINDQEYPLSAIISDDGKVEVYSLGLVCCSVCARKEISIPRVVEVVNQLCPTGIATPWKLSEDEFFHSREGGKQYRNGCDCPDIPTRRHFLLEC